MTYVQRGGIGRYQERGKGDISLKRKRKDDALRKAPEGRRPAAPREKK